MSPHHRRSFVKARQLSFDLDAEVPEQVVIDAVTPTPAIVPLERTAADLSDDLPYLPDAR